MLNHVFDALFKVCMMGKAWCPRRLAFLMQLKEGKALFLDLLSLLILKRGMLMCFISKGDKGFLLLN